METTWGERGDKFIFLWSKKDIKR